MVATIVYQRLSLNQSHTRPTGGYQGGAAIFLLYLWYDGLISKMKVYTKSNQVNRGCIYSLKKIHLYFPGARRAKRRDSIPLSIKTLSRAFHLDRTQILIAE